MRKIGFAGALALVVLVAACSEKKSTSESAQKLGSRSQERAAGKSHPGTGIVQSIDGDKITLAHGPISSIGWPAMTMTFTAGPGAANGLKAGDKVDFNFRQDQGTYVLTSVERR